MIHDRLPIAYRLAEQFPKVELQNVFIFRLWHQLYRSKSTTPEDEGDKKRGKTAAAKQAELVISAEFAYVRRKAHNYYENEK